MGHSSVLFRPEPWAAVGASQLALWGHVGPGTSRRCLCECSSDSCTASSSEEVSKLAAGSAWTSESLGLRGSVVTESRGAVRQRGKDHGDLSARAAPGAALHGSQDPPKASQAQGPGLSGSRAQCEPGDGRQSGQITQNEATFWCHRSKAETSHLLGSWAGILLRDQHRREGGRAEVPLQGLSY